MSCGGGIGVSTPVIPPPAQSPLSRQKPLGLHPGVDGSHVAQGGEVCRAAQAAGQVAGRDRPHRSPGEVGPEGRAETGRRSHLARACALAWETRLGSRETLEGSSAGALPSQPSARFPPSRQKPRLHPGVDGSHAARGKGARHAAGCRCKFFLRVTGRLGACERPKITR